MPEWRLAVKFAKMLSEPVPRSACAGRFKIVDQYRYIRCRMHINKPVDVIWLTAELQPLAAPGSKDFGKGGFETGKQFQCQRFAAIFSHKDDSEINFVVTPQPLRNQPCCSGSVVSEISTIPTCAKISISVALRGSPCSTPGSTLRQINNTARSKPTSRRTCPKFPA